ncbi:MAG: Holliday junction resolvase RuvX [Candidatus Omnitrophica bacterium]|nr:Holliday junction resolvase RuvX [Candidatus Omnitrophota bacterium]
MRMLGLDVGDRRIGVAMSDALGLTAQPVTVIERRTLAKDAAAILALVDSHHVEGIVVGLPLTLRGAEGPQAKKVTVFVEALRRRVTIPIQTADERLTTVQGERTLIAMDVPRQKRKEVIDRVAAQLILQHYLDTQRDEQA